MAHVPAALAIYLLGPPRIERHGQLVEVDTRKAIALLAYLALHPERLSRDQLAAFLWPEYYQERAYANLRRTLWALNKAVGEGWLVADNLTLALRQQAGLWIDVVEFQRLLAACRLHPHAG
jgi:DNA-binding SARP family transcriptional activator